MFSQAFGNRGVSFSRLFLKALILFTNSCLLSIRIKRNVFHPRMVEVKYDWGTQVVVKPIQVVAEGYFEAKVGAAGFEPATT